MVIIYGRHLRIKCLTAGWQCLLTLAVWALNIDVSPHLLGLANVCCVDRDLFPPQHLGSVSNFTLFCQPESHFAHLFFLRQTDFSLKPSWTSMTPIPTSGRSGWMVEREKAVMVSKSAALILKTSAFFSISAISGACFSNKTETEKKKDSLQTHKHDYSALNFDLWPCIQISSKISENASYWLTYWFHIWPECLTSICIWSCRSLLHQKTSPFPV